jgi:tetratricopeptide (TPR) repeat protein
MDENTKKLGAKEADAAAGWLKTFVTARLADEKRKPKAIEAWFHIGEVRRAAAQPDKQKAVYEEMIASLGATDEILAHLALWYKANNQRELARATYGKYKNTVEGQSQIAHSYSEERQYDKAVAIYRQLAIAEAKSSGKWLGQAAMAYRHGGKPDQAIAVYRELLVADATNAAEYHFQIAETLYGAHRWKECITAYRGTERFPHNFQHMAAAHRQLKEYNEAIGLYTQIIASSPPTASWALYQIGVTHEEAGKQVEAIKVFKQVCDKFPKSSEGSQAHAHLNQKYKISVTLGGAKD